MKLKLTLILLCFCSSVFSGDIILNVTHDKTGDPLLEPLIWMLKEQSDGYLFHELGYYEQLKIVDEDESMLTLSSIYRDSDSHFRGLYLFVIHKIDKVFSFTFYAINSSRGVKRSPADVAASISPRTGTVRFSD